MIPNLIQLPNNRIKVVGSKHTYIQIECEACGTAYEFTEEEAKETEYVRCVDCPKPKDKA